MSNKSLDEIFNKYSAVNTHYGTDKTTSHSYGTVYENLFEMFRQTPRILEVGFDGGASLLAYADYFSNATIYGIDIEDNRLPAVKEHPRIKTFIGDATKQDTVNHFGLTYDLVIEDASHLLHHQIQHFHDFSPFVNPGGLYIIEDVAEINLEALKEHVCPVAESNGFDFYLYDLRSTKGRFDDILFIFQKRTQPSLLRDRLLKKLQSTSSEQLVGLRGPLRHSFETNFFEDMSPKNCFFKWLHASSSREALLFFTRLYEQKDWKILCELFLYPLLLNAPYKSFWNFSIQEYLTTEVPHIPSDYKRVSLDVGMAFNGPNTSEWVKNPSMFVLGFEPNPTNLRILHLPYEETVAPPNYPYDRPTYWLDSKYIGKQVQIFPFALSDEMGTTEFYCTSNDPGTSSMYKPTRFDLEAKVTVPKRTLSSILLHFPWDRIPYIDHLKIDAQGHDFEILLGSLSYLDRVAYINVEMSVEGQYEDVPNKFHFINTLLQSQGFKAYNMEGGNCSYVNTNILDYCKTFRPQFIDL